MLITSVFFSYVFLARKQKHYYLLWMGYQAGHLISTSTERGSAAAGLWVGCWSEVQILFSRLIFVQLSWLTEFKLSKNTGAFQGNAKSFQTCHQLKTVITPFHALLALFGHWRCDTSGSHTQATYQTTFVALKLWKGWYSHEQSHNLHC